MTFRNVPFPEVVANHELASPSTMEIRMQDPPQPSTYGQTIEFQRSLYEALLLEGYSDSEMLKMSLRQALLNLYGSPEAVDRAIGAGTYYGVQQRQGGLCQWRKAWSRLRKEREARHAAKEAALETLKSQVAVCLELGIPFEGIVAAASKMLCTSGGSDFEGTH